MKSKIVHQFLQAPIYKIYIQKFPNRFSRQDEWR